jgi:hypothetical protein
VNLNEWLQWICLTVIAGILLVDQVIGWIDDRRRGR